MGLTNGKQQEDHLNQTSRHKIWPTRNDWPLKIPNSGDGAPIFAIRVLAHKVTYKKHKFDRELEEECGIRGSPSS